MKRFLFMLALIIASAWGLAMANKFVSQPLDKQMNRENIIDQIAKLGDAAGVRPSAVIGNLSELSPDSGDQVAGTYYVVDQATGAIRGYLTATPTEQFPGYYLAFFDNSGAFQFGVNADNGQAVAGAGAVTLDASGIAVSIIDTYSDPRSYKLVDSNGVTIASLRGILSPGTQQILTQLNVAARAGYNSELQLRADNSDTDTVSMAGMYADYNGTNKGRMELRQLDGVAEASIFADTVVLGTLVPRREVITIDAAGKAYYNGEEIGTNDASPISTNMLTRNADAAGQGTWVKTVSSSYLFGGTFYNSTSANGDNFTVNFYLPAGTYKLQFNATKASNRGIVKVEVGATNLGNTDLYAASNDYLNIAEYTNITIATGGTYAVKFTLNGKNASSSSYQFSVQGIEFIRTA